MAPPAPAGVYRGPCGVWVQDQATPLNPGTGHAQAGITAYAAWLGQPVSYVLDYITDSPSSWAQFTGAHVTSPQGDVTNYTALSTWGSLGTRKLVLGTPACAGRSTGSGGTTWAAEAAGANDSYWTSLGTNLVTWGYSTAVIRIGREWNGNWYGWSPALTGDTPASYIAGWQHIVTTLRAVAGSSFTFMWNPITGPVAGQAGSSSARDTQAWYPGSSYVDSIGLDIYDWGNGSYPTQTAPPYGNRTLAQQQNNFAFLKTQQDGLDSWANFSNSVGRPLAFPEWGPQLWLSGTSYIGGGDDPYFISSMTSYMSGALMQALWEDIGAGLFDTDAYAGRTSSIQAPDVARSTFLFTFGSTNTGSGGAPYSGSGSTGGSTGQQVVYTTQPPGSPPGPTGKGGTGASQPGAGWEIFVRSYADYTTLLCQIPTSVWTTFQGVKQLNDVGSGSVTLSMDAPWWKTAVMGGGATANEILDYECLWQITQDGVVRYEFLGETVTEQLVDASEQRLVTVTGPGTAATLKWAMAAPSGFPAIINKLDGLADSFGEIAADGSGVLDANIWTTVSPAGGAYITPVPQAYSYPGGAGYALTTLYPAGTLTISATTGTTLLGSTPWDATDTLVSAQISPVGAAGSATDASGNPVAYGSNLDGSELTQMYIESLKNTAYVAGFGVSAQEFYAWFADSGGTSVHVISSATGYDLTNYAYWMITEQGGTGGGPGTFYWWTSPDGSAWTQQWTVVHSWDATEVGLFFTAKYDSAGKSAILSSVNANVTTPSYQGNLYLGSPAMGIWADLLATAQARGTIPFVGTAVTAAADSFGNAWTDTQNVQVTNGTDLFTLLQGFCQVLDADFVMQPGFTLQVGQDIALGGSAVSLGTDRSGQVVVREARDELAKQRVRARDKIANLLGVENSDGHEISANSASSIAQWGQREGWFQTSALVDPASMEIAAAAFTASTDTEVLSWTLSIVPNIAGHTIFTSFDVGDWVGLERPDFSAVDAERVIAIAVQVDQDGAETHELTLQSYLAYLQEQFSYISSKLGGGFVNLPGTTPVAPSKYGTGQVPTWFTPAATLANLADVVGTGGTGGAPLVYNAATGQWQSASAADPVSGSALGLSVPGTGGTVSVSDGVVTVSSAAPAPAVDGGGTGTPTTTTTTPTGTTVTDATGTTRLLIGHQSDGTVTVVEQNAAAPATPDTPVVAAGPLGVVVTWDGLLSSAAPLLDFAYVQVHGSVSSGFTPSSATLQGTLAAGGQFGIGALTAGTTYYVKLVASNKSFAASTPSTQASAVPFAPGGAKVTFAVNASPPASPATGDLWYVTDQGNQLKTWNGSSWVLYQYGTSAIATGAITTNEILNGTIVAGDISATAAITGSQLAAAAGITGTQLSSSAGITGTQLASATITTTQLAGTVTARALGGITTTISLTAPGSPATGDIWINTTTGTIEQYSGSAWNVVTFNAANAIQAGTITASQILAGTITATQLAANSVTASQLAANSITAADMLANTITAGQIAANTITAGQIAANTITASQLAANSVTAAAMLAGTITATQIAAGTITAAKLAAGIIVAGIVDTTTINASTLLIYSGTPGAGNLVGSFASAAGTDAYGNAYPVGVSCSQGTFEGISVASSDIVAPAITGGSLSGTAIAGAGISGGTMSETSITFDQVGGVLLVYSTTTTTATLTTGTSWTAPAGSYTQGKVECWGADAGGGGGNTSGGGEAGGGGAYSCEPNYPLTPGNVYGTAIGAAGTGGWTGSAGTSGGQTSFDGGGVVANGGQAGSGGVGGAGGSTSGNTVSHPGGTGGSNPSNYAPSAGGGGRAGSTGAGGNGNNPTSGSGGFGGSAGTGTGGIVGSNGVASGTSGNSGNAGGSGAGKGGSGTTWQTQYYDPTSTASYYGSGVGGGLRGTNGSMFQGDPNVPTTTYPGDQVSFGNYNHAQMASDWSVWTVDQVTISLNNQHSWYNSGCYAILGWFTTGAVNTYNAKAFWVNQGANSGFVDITGISGLVSHIQAGTFGGIILGPSSSTSGGSGDLWNYGYFQGNAGAGGPRLTITGHQGSGGSYQAGGGSNGVIKVTYTSSSALLAAVAPAAGTDGSSNAYGPGFTGQISAFQPGLSTSAVETWHDLSPTGSWNVTSGYLKYRLTPENEVQISAYHLQNGSGGAGSTDGTTIATLPVGYRPSVGHEFPVAADVLGVFTGSNDKGAKFNVGTGGAIDCYNLSTANQVYISFEVRIPLSF